MEVAEEGLVAKVPLVLERKILDELSSHLSSSLSLKKLLSFSLPLFQDLVAREAPVSLEVLVNLEGLVEVAEGEVVALEGGLEPKVVVKVLDLDL